MSESTKSQINPHKIISRLSEQNANLNIQIIALTIALEEEIAKNLKGGEEENGDTKTK